MKSENTFIARQRLGKHIPTATNTQASIEVVIKKSSVEFRDTNLPGYELGSLGIKLTESAIVGDREEMARKELYSAKKTSCVMLQ
jgi:hypothetical protein